MGRVAVEVHVKVIWPLMAIALVLPLAASCRRTIPPPTSKSLERACLVVIAADPGPDRDITKLQQDLREHRSPARAAEYLGYRFVARARLSNDPGYYKVAEQAAACLEAIAPKEPAALLLRGHVLHQMHRFGEAEAIARRLVASREFALDFGLLGDALMEQGQRRRLPGVSEDDRSCRSTVLRARSAPRWLRGDLIMRSR